MNEIRVKSFYVKKTFACRDGAHPTFESSDSHGIRTLSIIRHLVDTIKTRPKYEIQIAKIHSEGEKGPSL